MPPRRKLAAVPVAERERPLDLRIAVKNAVDDMDWLTSTDMALKTLALRLAEEIETAIDRAEELTFIVTNAVGKHDIYARMKKHEAVCDVTKTVGLLAPQLQAVLRDLGGAPAARAAMKRDKPVGSRLAQLRDAATKH